MERVDGIWVEKFVWFMEKMGLMRVMWSKVEKSLVYER